MRILVFGNPLLAEDSIAMQIMPKLQKKFPQIDFVEFDSVEDLEKEGPELFILDAIAGIKQCEIITDLNRFEAASRNLSLHDFDLYQTLLILRQMKIVQKLTVIGIPAAYSQIKAVSETVSLIKRLI